MYADLLISKYNEQPTDRYDIVRKQNKKNPFIHSFILHQIDPHLIKRMHPLLLIISFPSESNGV